MLGPIALLVIVPPGHQPDAQQIYRSASTVITRNMALEIAPDLFSEQFRRSLVAACATDDRCFAERVRRSGFDGEFVLVLSAATTPDGTFSIAARLIERNGVTRARAARRVADELFVELEVMFASMFPSWGAIGGIRIESRPTDALASVERTNCNTPCTVERLVPGDYDVSVQLDDYKPWLETVRVEAGRTTKTTAELTPTVTTNVLGTWWFWAIVGTVAVGATTAIVVGTRGGPVEVCLGGDC